MTHNKKALTDISKEHSVHIPVGQYEPPLQKNHSIWFEVFQKFLKDKLAVFSAIYLIFLIFISMLTPLIHPHSYQEIFWEYINESPKLSNFMLFGTDANGRDLFVRTMLGIRISLLVSIIATTVSLLIGTTYGALSGFLGGKIDNLMMRFVDVLYSIPFMFLIILLMVLFNKNFIVIFVAIGAIEWMDMARIVRGQTLSIKKREFVQAAMMMGVSRTRIIFHHIIPNALGPVIVFLTLLIPKVILIESFLSFLGLGVQEPMTSLGVLVSEGAQSMQTSWWALVFPASFLASILLAFNYMGDGIRDALDTKS